MKRFFSRLTRRHWVLFFILSAVLSLMGYGIKYLVSEHKKKEERIEVEYPY